MGQSCSKGLSEEAQLLKAARVGDEVTTLAILRRHVAWCCNVQTWNGQSVWHLAAHFGHVHVIKALVEALEYSPSGPKEWKPLLRLGHSTAAIIKAMANHEDVRLQTPLHLACMHGHAEVVRLLLSLGASAWMGDELGGRTPLHYAASMGHVECISALLADPSPNPGRAVLRPPNKDRTKLVDVMNDCGYTALHYAVWAEASEAIRALVSYDANLTAKNTLFSASRDWVQAGPKTTPLHLAAWKGSADVVRLLLVAYVQSTASSAPGTQPRRRDPRRQLNGMKKLPYHIAVTRGHTHICEVLHPDVPYSFIVSAEDIAAAARLYGAPKLSIIAAAALQRKLQTDIDNAEELFGFGPGGAAAGGGSSHAGLSPLLTSVSRSASSLSGRQSRPTPTLLTLQSLQPEIAATFPQTARSITLPTIPSHEAYLCQQDSTSPFSNCQNPGPSLYNLGAQSGSQIQVQNASQVSESQVQPYEQPEEAAPISHVTSFADFSSLQMSVSLTPPAVDESSPVITLAQPNASPFSCASPFADKALPSSARSLAEATFLPSFPKHLPSSVLPAPDSFSPNRGSTLLAKQLSRTQSPFHKSENRQIGAPASPTDPAIAHYRMLQLTHGVAHVDMEVLTRAAARSGILELGSSPHKTQLQTNQGEPSSRSRGTDKSSNLGAGDLSAPGGRLGGDLSGSMVSNGGRGYGALEARTSMPQFGSYLPVPNAVQVGLGGRTGSDAVDQLHHIYNVEQGAMAVSLQDRNLGSARAAAYTPSGGPGNSVSTGAKPGNKSATSSPSRPISIRGGSSHMHRGASGLISPFEAANLAAAPRPRSSEARPEFRKTWDGQAYARRRVARAEALPGPPSGMDAMLGASAAAGASSASRAGYSIGMNGFASSSEWNVQDHDLNGHSSDSEEDFEQGMLVHTTTTTMPRSATAHVVEGVQWNGFQPLPASPDKGLKTLASATSSPAPSQAAWKRASLLSSSLHAAEVHNRSFHAAVPAGNRSAHTAEAVTGNTAAATAVAATDQAQSTASTTSARASPFSAAAAVPIGGGSSPTPDPTSASTSWNNSATTGGLLSDSLYQTARHEKRSASAAVGSLTVVPQQSCEVAAGLLALDVLTQGTSLLSRLEGSIRNGRVPTGSPALLSSARSTSFKRGSSVSPSVSGHRANLSPSASGHRGSVNPSVSGHRPSSTPGSTHDPSVLGTRASAMAPSRQQSALRELRNNEDEDVCGVCLDLPDAFKLQSCGHRLCINCSRELCKLHLFQPALCPFCRGMIRGFTLA